MSMKTDPTEFAGKRVLVSGGTKGLGRATVERFLAGGARIVTAARAIKYPIEGVEYVQAWPRQKVAKPLPRQRSNGLAGSTFSPMSSVARLHLRVASLR
jgi:NAD(P)-dependent dehydrogenase (short-subunit alcohol dehydrogenase family)